MDQDAVVADYTTIITTDAASLTSLIFDFHEDLGTKLFSVGRLDAEHRTELQSVSAVNLIVLRQRCEQLLHTIQTAISIL